MINKHILLFNILVFILNNLPLHLGSKIKQNKYDVRPSKQAHAHSYMLIRIGLQDYQYYNVGVE